MQILDYNLVLTCGAFPEQYDVFDSEGKQVGYLRLRHGRFYAAYPDHGGEIVYSASPEGDGIFACHEREFFLTEAVKAIHNHVQLEKE